MAVTQPRKMWPSSLRFVVVFHRVMSLSILSGSRCLVDMAFSRLAIAAMSCVELLRSRLYSWYQGKQSTSQR